MRGFRNIILGIIAIIFSAAAVQAQVFEPVKWKYEVKALGDQEYEIIFKATIDDGWHLYSQFVEEGEPVPTSFGFDSIPEIEFIGPVEERGELETDFDPNFDM